MNDTKDYKYLGWMNGWKETPKEWGECPHTNSLRRERMAECWTRVYCDKCQVYVDIDSSG